MALLDVAVFGHLRVLTQQCCDMNNSWGGVECHSDSPILARVHVPVDLPVSSICRIKTTGCCCSEWQQGGGSGRRH